MADTLIDTVVVTEVLEVPSHQELASQPERLEIIEHTTQSLVFSQEALTEVVDATHAADIIELATQGVPGPPGQSGAGESGPVLTYQGGRLVRIDYISGNYRLLSYVGERLVQVDQVSPTLTRRKSLSYNPDGTLAQVAETTF